MGKRTHLLLTVVVALMAAAVASVAAVASTVAPALACSIAAPHVEVRPSENLRPGQHIEVVGWAFHAIEINSAIVPIRPQPDPPANQDISPPDAAIPDFAAPLCDFTLTPLGGLEVTWQGATNEWLGRVDGPDFVLIATVPTNAAPGSASIVVGAAVAHVRVGPDVPPPPCPLAANPDGTATHICPDPDPCPLFEAHAGAAPQPALGADVASGFVPPCPVPCIDAAHTIDRDAASGYWWDCPDPCGYPEVNPGAADASQPVRCPPPDPCAVYWAPGVAGQPEPAGADAAIAQWCPDPCAYPAVASDAAEASQQVWCPTPLPDPPAIAISGSISSNAAADFAAASPVPPATIEPAADVYRSVTNRVLRFTRIVHALFFG